MNEFVSTVNSLAVDLLFLSITLFVIVVFTTIYHKNNSGD